MTDEEYIPYPGVEKEKPKPARITPIDEQIQEIEDSSGVENKRRVLREKQKAKQTRTTERQLDKEIKELEDEEKHPTRVRLRNRSKKVGSAVGKQVGRAWRHTERVAVDVAKYRKENPPRVIARPRGMRMASGPSSYPSNSSKEPAVSSTTERNFFSNPSAPAQEKDFFGPSKLVDLIGGGNQQKKEVDYLGNKDKKKNIRYY